MISDFWELKTISTQFLDKESQRQNKTENFQILKNL